MHANRVYAGQAEMCRVIFVFPVVTFSCDTDHKSSFHSTQLTLITADSAG